MSHYDDDRRDDRRRHKDRHRHSRARSPVYEEDEIIQARKGPKGSGRGGGELVPRPRGSSESSVEEVPRYFPPAGGQYDRRRGDHGPTRSKSARDSRRGGRRYDDGDDYYDGYDDRPRRRGKRDRRRDYSSSSSGSISPPRERRKSLGEQALGALGIGGTAAAALAGRSKSHDRGDRSSRRDRRSRRYSSSSSSSRSRGRGKEDQDPREKMIKAARAAVLAGGAEAWRMRKEPGGWAGPKGRRVLTAAVGAAGINGLVDKDPNKTGTRHTIESVIGGLASNRLINGSRKDEESRSRSRSRGRGDRDSGAGGIAGLSAGALAAAAGKAFMDRAKSKGRGRRDYSSSSDDGRGGGRHRRSKSVSDYMSQGMGAFGIGGNKDKRDTINRGPRCDPGYESDEYAPASRPRGGIGEGVDSNWLRYGGHSSSEDDESSSEDEKERKKLGKKQLITAGLASVATINAANKVYQSISMRQVRAKKLAGGELSPNEARKEKHKALRQNVASIGIAALGVKSAYKEWEVIKDQREEAHEFDARRAQRQGRRLLKQYPHQHSSPPDNSFTPSSYATPNNNDYAYTHTNGSAYLDGHILGSTWSPDLYRGVPPSPRYSDSRT